VWCAGREKYDETVGYDEMDEDAKMVPIDRCILID